MPGAGAEIRLAAAALELSEGRAEQAIDELRPVLEGTAQARCHPWAAHDRGAALRRQRHAASSATRRRPRRRSNARSSWPSRKASCSRSRSSRSPSCSERHRGFRTRHATLVSAILEVLSGSSPPPDATPLLDPLSEAELRVLRYLPSNLKAPEIASELFVSRNTVSTHLRHIYAKLDVHTRSEAVARARQLGLLAPA